MQMKRGCRASLSVTMVLLVEFACGSAEADIASGRKIAERWCSECHVVAPGQRQASDSVPTFAQINRSGRFDEATLSAFLANPHHSRMPDLSLTRSEIADLVAYIRRQGR